RAPEVLGPRTLSGSSRKRSSPSLILPCRSCCPYSRPVVIDVLHLQRVFLDEIAARFDFFAHERAEQFVGFESIVKLHLQEGALGWVESGFPQLFAVHFSQAF